jgi:hypothetical protein
MRSPAAVRSNAIRHRQGLKDGFETFIPAGCQNPSPMAFREPAPVGSPLRANPEFRKRTKRRRSPAFEGLPGGVPGHVLPQPAAVFGIPDFVYILALEPLLEAGIGKRLRGKDSLYTSNCPFLEGGVGPCIFPPDVRPEVCITSFCRGDEPLKAEIRRIKIGFWKLGVLVGFRRIPLLHRLLVRAG